MRMFRHPLKPFEPSARAVAIFTIKLDKKLLIIEQNISQVDTRVWPVGRWILRSLEIKQVSVSVRGFCNAKKLQKYKPRGLLIP